MIQLSRDQIANLIDAERVIAAISDAYIAVTDGRATLPPVGYLGFPGRNADCHIKYGYIEGDPIFVVKIASGFYDNPALGRPSSNGLMIAMSAITGELVAILNDEGLLTDLRTGFGGAIATFALCRSDSEAIGIVGTGTQARCQIRAARDVGKRPLRFSVWGRERRRVEALVADMSEAGIDVIPVPDLEQLCRASDVIVTTTPSVAPLVMSDWVRAGTHITAMGADAPGKQELEIALVARAGTLVADLAKQALSHGEFSNALAAGRIEAAHVVELGDVLDGRQPGRRSNDEITIADLTGIATQDIAIARTVLDRAGVLPA